MNRKSLLARITKRQLRIRGAEQTRDRLTWEQAGDLVLLRGTFAAGQDKAFRAAAATAARKSESWVDNLVKAYEARESLTPAQRKLVADWTYDMVLSLRGKDMTTAKRTSLITKVNKEGTRSPVEVRKHKRSIVGTTKRNRKGKAEQTTALAKSIGPAVAKLVKAKHSYVSLIAGAQLAQDNPGKDIAAALLFLSTQASAAAKVVK